MHTSAGRGQRKEVTFFQKSEVLSVAEERAAAAQDAWEFKTPLAGIHHLASPSARD